MPGIFYHMNDVSVYLGRQRRGGIPHRENELQVLSAPSTGVLNIHKAKNVPLQVRNTKNTCAKCVLSMGDPPNLCLPR